ncbi:MAG: DUF3618 domain-containing protein [Janthinobacterium lividum]
MVETTDTDAIERDLAKTRARMDNRLDELQGRLSPAQMINDALANFTGGDGAEFTQGVIARIKVNPLPAALAGVGLAWLMASSSKPAAAKELYVEPSFASRLQQAEISAARHHDEDADAHASRLDEARGKVLGIARNASDTAQSYGQRIKDAMASATQSTREAAHDLSASASGVTAKISDQAQRGSNTIQEGIDNLARSTREALSSVTANPFALAGLAVVVGIVAGAVIPTSSKEEELLGDTATRVRTAGHDLAQDVVDRGGRVATETIDAVKDSAQAHGLTTDKPIGEVVADLKSGSLADAAKQVASEVANAGKDSAQTHFGGAANGAGGSPSSAG